MKNPSATKKSPTITMETEPWTMKSDGQARQEGTLPMNTEFGSSLGIGIIILTVFVSSLISASCCSGVPGRNAEVRLQC